jgi:predicted ATP-dependent endonuclease of OLD family
MIKKIKIKNFRCFENCEIDFKTLSILVGKNNAGKSTLIEALRLVSVGVNRAESINYTPAPNWLKIDNFILGITPSIENLDISESNIFYLYGDAPAIIETLFHDGSSIETYIGKEAKVFMVLYDKEGRNVVSKKMASELKLEPINILPQISPIQREESILKYATVQKNLDTKLSSRNFRNQLKFYNQYFDKFKTIAESTWRGLGIKNLDEQNGVDDYLLLMVRDNKFEAEIGWMGHGLQMWLQTMWFISKCNENSTVILDEPDVYMHADLQRRLIRFIKGKFNQIIIATHSVEIMAEVEAENILPVDSSKKKLAYANKTPIVQKIIDDIGSIHNLEIARMFSHKKFLIVEGEIDDIKILSILQGKLYSNTFEPFDILPKTFVDGWGGWQRVVGSNKVFTDNNSEIQTYCIFDSDYHTKEEIKERIEESEKIGLNLHIWSRKEIENYLVEPKVILRLIKSCNNKAIVNLQDVEAKINSICEELKEEVIDDFATEIHSKDKGNVVKTANQKAREYVNSQWDNCKICLVPGKKLISAISKWTNKDFKLNLNAFKLARSFNKEEINTEIVNLIQTIEKGEKIKH